MANHSFVIGEAYRDLRGRYKVISVEENRLVYDYGDGVQQISDAETKWRIYRNNFLSEQSPLPTARSSQTLRSVSEDKFWDDDEVGQIFAEVIRAYGKRRKDFMTHERIVAGFIAHPEGQRILNRPHDERPNQYWVGVMVAWFSRLITDGKSEWADSFERKKIGSAWAYRVRQGKN